ncbi:MAG: replication-associated recombination protein A, partial [Lachnospiraceae bacterium]|nr:replication-associated recombination protein A [Lachnospiraceae bacterium]
HLFPNHFSRQRYLPEEYDGMKFYEPGDLGYEKHIKEWLAFLRGEGKENADK